MGTFPVLAGGSQGCEGLGGMSSGQRRPLLPVPEPCSWFLTTRTLYSNVSPPPTFDLAGNWGLRGVRNLPGWESCGFASRWHHPAQRPSCVPACRYDSGRGLQAGCSMAGGQRR